MTPLADDLPFAQALYSALKPDPFYAALERACPEPQHAQDAMLRYYQASIRDAAQWGRVGIPPSGQNAISLWSVPLSVADSAARKSAKHKGLLAALGPAAVALFHDIEASMAEQEAALDLDGYWYLSILGVHPSQQGKGLGALALTAVLAEADAAGVASYLTTFTPRNIPFYQRQGFALVETFPEPVTDSRFSVLVRPPGG